MKNTLFLILITISPFYLDDSKLDNETVEDLKNKIENFSNCSLKYSFRLTCYKK